MGTLAPVTMETSKELSSLAETCWSHLIYIACLSSSFFFFFFSLEGSESSQYHVACTFIYSDKASAFCVVVFFAVVLYLIKECNISLLLGPLSFFFFFTLNAVAYGCSNVQYICIFA